MATPSTVGGLKLRQPRGGRVASFSASPAKENRLAATQHLTTIPIQPTGFCGPQLWNKLALACPETMTEQLAKASLTKKTGLKWTHREGQRREVTPGRPTCSAKSILHVQGSRGQAALTSHTQ